MAHRSVHERVGGTRRGPADASDRRGPRSDTYRRPARRARPRFVAKCAKRSMVSSPRPAVPGRSSPFRSPPRRGRRSPFPTPADPRDVLLRAGCIRIDVVGSDGRPIDTLRAHRRRPGPGPSPATPGRPAASAERRSPIGRGRGLLRARRRASPASGRTENDKDATRRVVRAKLTPRLRRCDAEIPCSCGWRVLGTAWS